MMKHVMNGAMLFALLGAAGCGSSKEAEKTKGSEFDRELHAYEEQFRPSDYDPELSTFFSELKKEKEETPGADASVVEPPVAVQGYRVQILATSSIDDANTAKAAAESEFPGEWFYIAYDPPTYKLRVGNFLSRSEAETYARVLAERGYPDAWVVPERVFKNIQPRPAQQSDGRESPHH